MRDEDGGTDLLEQRCDGARVHLRVVGTRVRRHRAEVLVERVGISREPNTREVVGPDADAKHAEPHLVVGRRRNRRRNGAASRGPATRLIEQVDREPSAQKDVLKPLASIHGRLPRLLRLACAVPEHERQRTRVHRDLIEHVRVIAVQRPAGPRWVSGVERARAPHDRAADRKAALRLQHERVRWRTSFASRRPHACARTQQREHDRDDASSWRSLQTSVHGDLVLPWSTCRADGDLWRDPAWTYERSP